ncbi:MAG: HAMP domain-containing protein [Planctomycetaceae bacterium]|nr:HAMP domain-containing protein [Planctomycetaceae bacterium]
MRRKLAVVVLIFLAVLGLFAVTSHRGITSYRAALNDLELSIGNHPSRNELVAHISALIQPLTLQIPADDTAIGLRHELELAVASDRSHDELTAHIDALLHRPDAHQLNDPELRQRREHAALRQYELFTAVFDETCRSLDEFEQKWRQLPDSLRHSGGEEIAFRNFLSNLIAQLNQLAVGKEALKDLSKRDAQVAHMLAIVGEMLRNAETIPDPANRLGERLREARESYDFHLRQLWLVFGLSTAAIIGLLLWLYQLILVPIQRLYRGVMHLAGGEFGYRLETGTRCELSHLARTFNEMAERIQTDRQTKQQQIEEGSRQLVQSERLAGIGMLATGVAHEINNPLMGIANAAVELQYILTPQTLEKFSEEDRNDLAEAMGIIRAQTKNCQAITQKLLSFAHTKKGEDRNNYDLTAIVQEVVSLVKMLKKFPDRTVCIDTTDPLHAWVNAAEIKQVILNIVTNGLQATPAGGELTIALKETPDDVEIQFTDTGCGMTPDQLKQIFDPFFTTKEVGQGTGLGLSLSRNLVINHNGTLEANSPGKDQGSTFTLRLPKSAQVFQQRKLVA